MKPFSVKQDINFLDKPLWFQDIRHDGMGFIWTDKHGYEYRTGYKPPDKVDILILFYLLLKSQKNDYQILVEASRREILKECDLPTRNNKYYERVEESLKRWNNVAIEFHGCFYDGKNYITIGFGIIDDYEIDKENKRVRVSFNEKWLLKLKESNFFKYMNFEYFKGLKRPLSMRLYELLCKTFKGRNNWSIHLASLGEKLALSKRARTKRDDKAEGVVYASDVLVAIKPAINEINRMAKTPGIQEKTQIPSEDLFTIDYQITGVKQERVITFHKRLVQITSSKTPSSIPTEDDEKNSKNSLPSHTSAPISPFMQAILDPTVAEKSQRQIEKKTDVVREEHLKTLCGLLKKRTTQITQAVESYYDQKGLDYVLWNIRYANENARRNYSTYLQKALKENWAEEWKEEEQNNQEVEIQERKAKREAAEKEDSQEREKDMFVELHSRLDREIKENLAQQAQAEENPQSRNSTMPARIRYMELVREHFRKQGTIISKEATGLLAFIKQVTSDIF